MNSFKKVIIVAILGAVIAFLFLMLPDWINHTPPSIGESIILKTHNDSTEDRAVFSPDGKFLAISGGNNLTICNTVTNPTCFALSSNDSRPLAQVQWNSDSELVAASVSTDTVKIWNVKSKRLVHTIDDAFFGGADSYTANNGFAFNPDGKTLTVVSKNSIEIWNVQNWTLKTSLPTSLFLVNFSPNNAILFGASEGVIETWDVDKTIKTNTFSYGTLVDDIRSLVVSPDGKLIAASVSPGFRVWKAQNGSVLFTSPQFPDRVSALAISPDGKTLVVGSSGVCGDEYCYKINDPRIQLWDINTFRLEKTLNGHTSDILSLCFGSDSKKLVSSSKDGTIRLWTLH